MDSKLGTWGFTAFFILVMILIVVGGIFRALGMIEYCQKKHPELSINACATIYTTNRTSRVIVEGEDK